MQLHFEMHAQSREQKRRMEAEKEKAEALHAIEACSNSLLLKLPEVLFHRIYGFIADRVAPHTAVCKLFRRFCL